MITKIRLKLEDSNYDYEITMFSEEPREIINKAVDKGEELINLWLEGKELPKEYDDCNCDSEFLVRALELEAKAYTETCDDEIVVWY